MSSMCGRAYSTYTDEELQDRYQNKKPLTIPSFKPNFNLSPSQNALVLFMSGDKRQLELFRWGLIPSWAKDTKIGYKMINARGETVTEKPSFRNAFKSRRAIVPLSGFIEWKRDGAVKRPFAIHIKDEPIMSVAGIWERWQPKDAEVVHSFSILTTGPNSLMKDIHDRMPVILAKCDEEEWLDPENEDVKGLLKLLKPCPSKWLEAYEISTLINSPKNNREEVLLPLSK